MTSIWDLLLQTASATLAAALLLAVKRLLRDHLSPRWQYGVWGVLALRLLLPVQSDGRYALLPVPLWLETVKAVAERSLRSAYAAVYAPIRIRFPLPWLSGRPESVTDWLFVLYVLGVLAVLLRYAASYARLRLLLRRSGPVSEATRQSIDAVCGRYGLRACPAVAVPGLPSAFVCGIVRPMLAVPAGSEPDEKVLLHELLHLEYADGAQSAAWSVLRALHWCNPLLQYAFDQIGNDMEQLCDQRVLERLEGEQRREYGGILLSMVNAKYPRAPGTTSLSNGGRNIARRIEAIARFKKYPRGMGLVSGCTGVVLLCACLFGASVQSVQVGGGGSGWTFARAMASARLTRCTTAAGALDTYAKGILYENGVYLAAASPLSAQEALAEKMASGVGEEGQAYWYLPTAPEGLSQSGYWIYNLKELPDGSYEALLVFAARYLPGEDGEEALRDENGDLYEGAVAYPVRVGWEEGWVVTQSGDRLVVPAPQGVAGSLDYGSALLPALAEYAAEGESGTVTARVQTVYLVDNAVESGELFSLFGETAFDQTVKPDAEFSFRALQVDAVYRFSGSQTAREGLQTVGIQLVELEDTGDGPVFQSMPAHPDSTGSSSDGSQWVNRTVTGDWDGTVTSGGGSGWSGEDAGAAITPPEGYAVRILWNGTAREDLILREVSADGAAGTA